VNGITKIPLPGRPLVCDADSARGRCRLQEFFAGSENRLVEAAVHAVFDDEPDGYSPLVFYGPTAVGKSHLARGLAAEWRSLNRSFRVEYTTAANFAEEFDEAIETRAVDEFRERYRTLSMFVCEDVELLAGATSTGIAVQDEFIHTLDALLSSDSRVVVTACSAPHRLSVLLPGLRSRLTAGLAVPLRMPGLGVRLAMLRHLAAVCSINMTEAALRLLADGLSTTVPELFDALVQLDESAQPTTRGIDVESVRCYLASRNGLQAPALDELAAEAAQYFSLKLSDLRSPSRRRKVVTARNVAVYAARHLTDASFQQIGRYFGGRDHTTIMHGYYKLKAMLEVDPAVRSAVEQLQRKWSTNEKDTELQIA